ncbi:hypothetical protein, conserved [Cyanidioschyzon merolae strain 10D]|jgi:hypothetical protein|uniref:N-acetyltransferase domain-containing protein n=1 Tax=Cyanidioschyzon merolae (strain NIES-3377 / 10D) TaxID=280699 RepID=M1V8H3_CYAM1|nr:hypothetical protein, conserved [Cyanidioschyzon merolae strain 10D]BAM80634.1 hypothetical protein, conserved [Cyanidioschyzon merolae strain 10D]|eukprot:XP_005536670.1 hypothetical protein, conserved [Cyanidioschyzon merolae strain 10D]
MSNAFVTGLESCKLRQSVRFEIENGANAEPHASLDRWRRSPALVRRRTRSLRLPLWQLRRQSGCIRIRLLCANSEPSSTGRPRVTPYPSQRAIFSNDKKAFTPAELNDLFVRCNEPPRDERKILRCLKYSFSVVSARLLGKDQRLVAFVRSISDGVMNATLWDVLVDPNLPNPAVMRRNIIRRMLDDLSRDIPLCSVAMIAPEDLVIFYEKECGFVAEPNGIRAMRLVRWPENLDELDPIETEDGGQI